MIVNVCAKKTYSTISGLIWFRCLLKVIDVSSYNPSIVIIYLHDDIQVQYESHPCYGQQT